MKINEITFQAAKNVAKRLWKQLDPTSTGDYAEDRRADAYIDIEIHEEATRLEKKIK